MLRHHAMLRHHTMLSNTMLSQPSHFPHLHPTLHIRTPSMSEKVDRKKVAEIPFRST